MDEATPLPALIVSATTERYARAASIVRRHGFGPRLTPAVFVNESDPNCLGTNGHRLAMRKAYREIVRTNRSTAVFEDDVMPAATGSISSSLAAQIRAHIERHENSSDILYLYTHPRLEPRLACHSRKPCVGCVARLPGDRRRLVLMDTPMRRCR